MNRILDEIQYLIEDMEEGIGTPTDWVDKLKYIHSEIEDVIDEEEGNTSLDWNDLD